MAFYRIYSLRLPNHGKLSSLVSKISVNSGSNIWIRTVNTFENEISTSVTVDNAGDIYVSGMTRGSIAGHKNAGDYDVFVLKLDKNGTILWTSQFGTASRDEGRHIKIIEANVASTKAGVSSSRNASVFVVGHTWGSLDERARIGNGFMYAGLQDGFITKLDAMTGERTWTRQVSDILFSICRRNNSSNDKNKSISCTLVWDKWGGSLYQCKD